MPFACIQSGGKWKCITKETGKVHGSFDTKPQCEEQMRALYAKIPEAQK